MQFASGSLGSVALGSLLLDPGAIIDPTSLRPILTEINGVDAREIWAVDSIRIQDTLGQPVTANFTVIKSATAPVVGDRVRMFFHAQLIFVGTIDRVEQTSPNLTFFRYQVECVDLSQILFRRKIRRNFTNVPIQTILDSILDNELAGETLTIGTIESLASMPLVDGNNARVFDVCRDMAGATGQTFYVDFDQTIQMRSMTAPAAPLVFSEDNVLLDSTSSQTDRETYRNVQTVIVTGTPAQGQTALVSTQQRTNADQIAARAAIEGGSGRYEEIEEFTHPTSNDGVALALLGIGYARLRLATSGTPRQTIRCRVRGYGFRAGQVATVSLPTFGLVGTFVIQRVSIVERAGRLLFHDLELTTSSLQQRAYESWLSIVRGKKVTVQMPGSVTNNLQTFNTPGTFTWTVPAGVTVAEFTCIGGSGGGGGTRPAKHVTDVCFGVRAYDGGDGGNSGKAITVASVSAGQVFDLVIGSAGTGGVTAGVFIACGGGVVTAGTNGTLSSVKLIGLTLCQGNPGVGGGAGPPGLDGAHGSGVGDAVVVGGGVLGGVGAVSIGDPWEPRTATAGKDGKIEVAW